MPTHLQRDLLLFGRRVSVVYGEQYEFNVDAAAPIGSPYSEGNGSLTVTDTGNKLTKSGGILVGATPTGVRDPWLRNAAGVSRVAGRAVIFRINKTSGGGNGPLFGWANTLTTPDTAQTYGAMTPATGVAIVAEPDNVSLGDVVTTGTYIKYTFLLFATGFALFVNASLNWICLVGAEATLFDDMMARAASDPWSTDYMRRTDFTGALTTLGGFATINSAAPVSGTQLSGVADCLAYQDITLNGAPAANDIGAELRYRVQDTSNYWTAYIKRNAGNTAWDFKLDSVAAGSPTSQLTVAGVGTPTKITARASGNLHDCYTWAATTPTKRGAQVNNSALATQSGVTPVAGPSSTLGQLYVWPVAASSPAYAPIVAAGG